MKMSCLFGHKFVGVQGQIICEKCGVDRSEPQTRIARNILGQPRKVEIVRREDSIEKIIAKDD